MMNAEPMIRPVIQISGVSKSFGRRPVLDDIALDIQGGNRIALVGSNGAGKTTLIRCLLGEYTYQGEIEVEGLAPRAARRRVLKRVGFVPQLPPPLKMPVGELVHFASKVCGDTTEGIESVTESLGLDLNAIRRQAFVKLSGGQKQKLLISIALARQCGVLIMDEPAANLDPESRQIFFRLLAERQDDTVMLISSHRLDEVAELVNRVVELDRGKVVLDDHVADDIQLDSMLECVLRLNRVEDAFAKAIGQWGFEDTGDGLNWRGKVAGPDRLRFLGLMSRYAGVVADLEMKESQGGGS